MVPDAASSTMDRPPSETSSNTFVNGLLGGIAGIILSFIPFSPLLGGGIAGYLEGGDSSDGLRVGAIAGGIMLIPFTFLLFVLMFFLGMGSFSAAFGLLAIFILFVGAAYTVGLSIVGGYLGIYVKSEL